MNLYTESDRFHIGLEGFVWFIGVVEERTADPDAIGRLKVRCFGWHTDDKELLPTAALPWAQIITPPNMPASYTCREGDYVFGFFMDAKSAQHPIIVGVLPGKPAAKPDYNLGFSDPNKRYPKRVGESTFSRLATAKEKYPYNWVHETETGHTFELDDNGKGRIKLKHNNGNYVEFDTEANMITIVKENSTVSVGANKSVKVGGDCTISVEGNCNFSVKGRFSVDASGGVYMSSGDSKQSISPLSVSSESATISSKAGLTNQIEGGVLIQTNGGIAAIHQAGVIMNQPAPLTELAGGATADEIVIEPVGFEIPAVEFPVEPSFLDGITKVTDAVTNGINQVSDFITDVVDDISEGIGGVIQSVTDPINQIKREIARDLKPITDTIDRIGAIRDNIQNSLDRIDAAFVPLERIVGKELFPRTNFVSRSLEDFDNLSSKVDRMYEPLVALNLEVINLNEQISTKILNAAYNPNLKDRMRKRTNKMNREVHTLNSFYNLSAKSNRKIPHLGGSIAGTIPDYAKYELETDFENYESYNDFDSSYYEQDDSNIVYGLAPSWEVGED